MSVEYKPGAGWCDVAHTISGFVRVWSGHGTVESDRWATTVPTDHLRYLRAASSPYGDVAAIGVGADDVAYLAHAGGWERWGPALGQNCVGLYWREGWVPVIQRTSESYSIGHAWTAFPPHIRGTSQGFRDVRPNGEIIFGDDAHWTEPVPGVVLHKPCQRGGVLVGQVDGTDRIDGVHGFDRRFSAIPGPAFEPHVAADGLGNFVICARTGRGAAFIAVPPFPPLVGPDPPPPDDDDDEEPPVPEDIARFIADQRDIVEAVIRDYPALGPAEICDQVAHRLNRKWGFAGSQIRFGRKARQQDGGNPNIDVVTFRLDFADNSKKKLIDILEGAKEGRKDPTWDVRPPHEEPNNGFWAPPVTADRDGALPPPDDDDDKPPPGLPQLDRIEQMLAQVLLKLNQIFR